jgi:hypothetical protein
MFPALSRMEQKFPPTRYDRDPLWRSPAPVPADRIYIPSWNWMRTVEIPEGEEVVTLDANGAFMGALSMSVIGHSHLSHTGPADPVQLTGLRDIPPGYYQISVPHWALSASIVSPLGDQATLQTEDTLWVAAPTVTLLLELLDQGAIGDLRIYDSWTARITTTFRQWANHLRDVRVQLIDDRAAAHPDGAPEGCDCIACDRYEALKEGYSAALSMMLTGEKCKTHRPDWTHTVIAQFAAAQWRKAWRYQGTGHPLMAMGDRDEISVLGSGLHDVLARPQPPFRYDPTGKKLGALKIKRTGPLLPPTQQAAALPTVDESEDIL